MSNYYGLIFIIAGGIFLALPAVVSSDLSKRKKKCNATAGMSLGVNTGAFLFFS